MTNVTEWLVNVLAFLGEAFLLVVVVALFLVVLVAIFIGLVVLVGSAVTGAQQHSDKRRRQKMAATIEADLRKAANRPSQRSIDVGSFQWVSGDDIKEADHSNSRVFEVGYLSGYQDGHIDGHNGVDSRPRDSMKHRLINSG